MADPVLSNLCGLFYDQISSIYSPKWSSNPKFREAVISGLGEVLIEAIQLYFIEKPDALTMDPIDEEGDDATFANMDHKVYSALWMMNQSTEQIGNSLLIVVPINEFIMENLDDARIVYENSMNDEEDDEEDDEETGMEAMMQILSVRKEEKKEEK